MMPITKTSSRESYEFSVLPLPEDTSPEGLFDWFCTHVTRAAQACFVMTDLGIDRFASTQVAQDVWIATELLRDTREGGAVPKITDESWRISKELHKAAAALELINEKNGDALVADDARFLREAAMRGASHAELANSFKQNSILPPEKGSYGH